MIKFRQVKMCSQGGYACIDGMHRTTAMQRNLDLGVLDGKVYAIVYKEDTPDDVVVGLATGTITSNDLVALICLLKQIHFSSHKITLFLQKKFGFTPFSLFLPFFTGFLLENHVFPPKKDLKNSRV